MFSIVLDLILTVLYLTMAIIYGVQENAFLCLIWSACTVCWGASAVSKIVKYCRRR